MQIIDVLNTLGLSSVITASVLFLIKRHYNKKDKKEEKKDECEKNIDNMNNKIKEHSEKIEGFEVSILIMSEASQAILRDRIIQMYNYYKEKEYFPIYARESLEHMYIAYKKLNGNGVIDNLVEDLMNLPTDK